MKNILPLSNKWKIVIYNTFINFLDTPPVVDITRDFSS